MKNGYNGQTRLEYNKNYKRIRDIISKTSDKEKQISLASRQCKLITDESKAINRAKVAKELGQEHLFDIFFRRAYELGSVSKIEYRDYVISKLIEN